MTALRVADRTPERGDILYHPGLGVREVVKWTRTEEPPRCGLSFRFLPENYFFRDDDEITDSWHCSGWPWLREGEYVSRADGGPVEVAQ